MSLKNKWLSSQNVVEICFFSTPNAYCKFSEITVWSFKLLFLYNVKQILQSQRSSCRRIVLSLGISSEILSPHLFNWLIWMKRIEKQQQKEREKLLKTDYEQ